MSTPSTRLIAAAEAQRLVSDAQGRQLTLRQLSALDKLRLFKAVGPALAQNEPYLGMAILACSVAAMDGVPIPAPSNEAQIEGLVSRLGDAGLEAVAEALEAEPLADAASLRAAAGN